MLAYYKTKHGFYRHVTPFQGLPHPVTPPRSQADSQQTETGHQTGFDSQSGLTETAEPSDTFASSLKKTKKTKTH